VTRLPVRKTYKLYIGGAFPRSESGRTFEAEGQNVARASRKDARDAVRAARAALPAWWGMTAYNRGQILYRLAEMMEARADELEHVCSGRDEVEAAIDHVVWYAGWADKLPQVLGNSNPVAGPYFNFTVPEPTGVVAMIAPVEPALDGLVLRPCERPCYSDADFTLEDADGAGDRTKAEVPPSDGSYGIPEGVVYGFPVRCRQDGYRIVQGLAISEPGRRHMTESYRELASERDLVRHLLGNR